MDERTVDGEQLAVAEVVVDQELRSHVVSLARL